MKIVLSFLLSIAVAGRLAAQTPVIFDSDMGPDYDDVGAITILHSFADAGKAKILATMASDKYEGVAAVLDLFNTYFHRPGIPVGVPRGQAVDLRDTQHWTDSLIAKYPHRIKRNDQAEDAVALYRKILAGQKDNSVVIISVGFYTNLSNLLQSKPDSYSSLDGTELVRRKVKRLVSMAGKFPAGKEFNVFMDAPASRNVASHWPGEIIYSGFEIGEKIKVGLPLLRNQAIHNSPVKDAFRISIPLAAEDSTGRMSWDETAVLVGIGGTSPFYTLVKGRMIVAEDGTNTWDSNGKTQAYLVEARPFTEVRDRIDRLIQK